MYIRYMHHGEAVWVREDWCTFGRGTKSFSAYEGDTS